MGTKSEIGTKVCSYQRSTINSTCTHDFLQYHHDIYHGFVTLQRDFTRHTALAFHIQHNIAWQRRYTSTFNLCQYITSLHY